MMFLKNEDIIMRTISGNEAYEIIKQNKIKSEKIRNELNKNYINKVKGLNDGSFKKGYKGKNKHYVLVTGYQILDNYLNKDEVNIIVNALTSIEDKNGNINPNKIRKVKNGLLIEIPQGKINRTRRNAIKVNVDDMNVTANRHLKIKDLVELQNGVIIDGDLIQNIKKNIFDTSKKDAIRKDNQKKAKSYKK